MTAQHARDSLEIEVTDFGPIVEANVDLRPLTVFVGPSNTGKSYLSILIYALHQFFGGYQASRHPSFRRGYALFRSRGVGKLSKTAEKALDQVAQSFREREDVKAQRMVTLEPTITDLIRSSLDRGGEALAREIRRCFGIENTAALIRRGQARKGARIQLRQSVLDGPARFEHQLLLTAQAAETKTAVSDNLSLQIPAQDIHAIVDYTYWADTRDAEYIRLRLLESLGDLVLPDLTGPLYLPAFYLPADRTGVMHAHSVVVSALIGSAPMAGLRPATRTPVLSGVLADFLEQLIEIDRPQFRRRRGQHDLGAGIEEGILDGTVRIERSAAIDYPRFTYRPDGWEDNLPLMNASSMVSELTPVVLYLRHLIRPGNVLIIEEPESHLHPAMQVEFTRQLAALVQEGVRVIVTTHSEWLLEELANIVRRSELPAAQRSKKNESLRALDSDQVGAWLFEPKRRPKGSVVKEIRLDDDSGLYPSGYADVAAALHNDWAEISSQIESDS